MSISYRLIDVKDEIKNLTGKEPKQLRTADKAIRDYLFSSKAETVPVSDYPEYVLREQSNTFKDETWYNLYQVDENTAYLVQTYDGGNTNEATVLRGPIEDICQIFYCHFNLD
jgi:hypothetical protein